MQVRRPEDSAWQLFGLGVVCGPHVNMSQLQLQSYQVTSRMLSAQDVNGTPTISCGHDNANTHASCTSLFVILIFLWVQMQAIQFFYILIEFPFNERFENIVQLLRVSRFIARQSMTRSQRLTIDFFRRYTINQKDADEYDECSQTHVRGRSVEAIVNGLNPLESSIDKRIVYELSGIKLNDTDFNDDTSFDEDEPTVSDDVVTNQE